MEEESKTAAQTSQGIISTHPVWLWETCVPSHNELHWPRRVTHPCDIATCSHPPSTTSNWQRTHTQHIMVLVAATCLNQSRQKVSRQKRKRFRTRKRDARPKPHCILSALQRPHLMMIYRCIADIPPLQTHYRLMNNSNFLFNPLFSETSGLFAYRLYFFSSHWQSLGITLPRSRFQGREPLLCLSWHGCTV